MRALISGITGQDGSYLAELLLEKGYEVIGMARRTSTPNTSRIDHLRENPKFTLVEGDVTDSLCVHHLVGKYWPDEIYNLSAQSHVHTSFKEASHTTDVTYKGCLNFLESLRILKEQEESWLWAEKPIKFYQASSSEMFGSAYSVRYRTGWDNQYSEREDFVGFLDQVDYEELEDEPFQDEFTPFHPQSPYAIAKLAAHHLVRLYRDSYGLFACSGILFNHESSRRSETFVTRKITKYVAEYQKARMECASLADASMSEPLKLGNLAAKRDWGHAKDYVRAMWMMLQHDKPDDYVVATGETHTVEEFLYEAFGVIGAQPYFMIDPQFLRPAEVPLLRGDSSKIQRELGWKPEISFKELVRDMVEGDLGYV